MKERLEKFEDGDAVVAHLAKNAEAHRQAHTDFERAHGEAAYWHKQRKAALTLDQEQRTDAGFAQAASKYKDAEAHKNFLVEQARTELLDAVRPANRHKLSATADASVPEGTKAMLIQGATFLKRMLARTDGDGDFPTIHHEMAPANDDRANYAGPNHGVAKPRIQLATHNDASVVVHEWGHAIENNVPGAQKAAQEFLRHRVGDEPLTKLHEQFPGSGFKAYETGRKDQFDRAFPEHSAYYVGKEYAMGDTEIISMGLEALHRDPVGFCHKDPEYAKFILGVMSGSLRSS
jgi:hypothetical protein